MTTTGLVHPSNLLRSNSRERVFAAPSNINSGLGDNFDWGITRLPFTSKIFPKYANVSVFVSLLAFLGFFQGVTYGYFGNTAKIWMKQFGFSQVLTDYLVNSIHIMSGVFGIFIAYWGNRIHRTSWISGLAIFHSIIAISLFIPEWYHPSFFNFDAKKVSNTDLLCLGGNSSISNLRESTEEKVYIALGFFIFHQLLFSFSLTSTLCHGLSYADDHIRYKNTTVCICIIYIASEFGKQIGLYQSYIPNIFNQHVFLSSAWILNASLIFIVAACIAMFPRELPSKILERGVASILDLTVDQETDVQTESFLSILMKLITTPAIILTTVAAAVMTIAVSNYEFMKRNFSRVRINNHWDSAFTSYSEPTINIFFNNFVVQTFKVVSALATSAVILRFQPKFKSLIYWLGSHYIKVAILFILGIFMKCQNVVYSDHKAFKTYCNLNCECNLDEFYPVCIKGKRNLTFYSPCFAGCSTIGENVYQNCSCHGQSATPGYCDGDNCMIIWFFSEANNTVRAGLLAGTVIINMLIILKASPKGYKAVGLGLYFAIVQLTPYFPFKLLYDSIRDLSCVHYNNQHVCTIYSSNFPIYMDVITAVLLGVSTFLILMLACFGKNFDLYGGVKISNEMSNSVPHRNNITSEPAMPAYDYDDIDHILREIEEEDEEEEHTHRPAVTSTSF